MSQEEELVLVIEGLTIENNNLKKSCLELSQTLGYIRENLIILQHILSGDEIGAKRLSQRQGICI